MNQKTREKIEKKAAETVKARHLNDAVGKVAEKLKAKGAPATPKVDGTALPPLPKMPSAARLRKDKPSKPCACGNCGAMTKSVWAPGHDAYCKGWALRVEREICKMSDVPKEVVAGVKMVIAEQKKAAGEDTPKPAIKIVKAKNIKAENLTAEANTSEAAATPEPAVGE